MILVSDCIIIKQFYVFIKIMKKIILILIWFILSIWFSSAYQQQWFDNYNEINWSLNFQCSTQCIILIWQVSANDFVNIKWSLKWVWILWYWFVVWQQIYPGETIQINWWWDIDQKFVLSNSQVYWQLPWDAQLALLIQWNFVWSQININWWIMWIFDNFINWFNWALQYKSYNPRTINFLEWPMRNWKYINQAFFKTILILLWLSIFWYFFSSKKENKKKSIYFWVWVIVFFWIFFDFFSTVNEMKIYNDVMDAPNIMENWRVWKDSDFYQFLDFVKTQVPKWVQWAFIASYPFYFEWKYHIYPDVKFNLITWVDYIFFYNPYWVQAPFGFIDPTYNSWILLRNDLKFSIQKEIQRKPYAKIYILKK